MPTIADVRQKLPQFSHLDDNQLVDVIQRAYYPQVPRDALAQRLGVQQQAPASASQETSLMRGAADTGIAAARGLVSGVKMLSDAAGADNVVSQTLGEAQSYLSGLESPARQQERAERAAKIKAAEASGSKIQEIGAYLGSFADAPLDTTVEALGTMAPTVAAALIPGVGPAAAAARTGAGLAMGAAQGAGSVKGSIYDETKQRLIESGTAPDVAAQRAAIAQGYAGPNSGQIALGAGLGAVAARTGLEGAAERLAHGVPGAVRGTAARVAGGAVAEAIPEAAQGGQERYATNLALRGEGFTDVDPMTGVTGSAALEGVTGGVLGGIGGIPRPQRQAGAPARAAQAVDADPRAQAIDGFRALASKYGLSGKALQAVEQAVRGKPADEAAAYMRRAAEAYQRRGLFGKALDPTDLDAAFGAAPGQNAVPAQDQGGAIPPAGVGAARPMPAPAPAGVDPAAGEVAAPTAAPAGPMGAFNTEADALAYISEQRRNSGIRLPAALPIENADGTWGVAVDGSPLFTAAQQQRAQRAAAPAEAAAAQPQDIDGAQIVPDAPFEQRLAGLRQQFASDASRKVVRDHFGSDEALGTALYYLDNAGRSDVPQRTRESMLGIAERILFDAQARLEPRTQPLGSEPFEAPAQLGADPAAPALPYDNRPTGRMRAGADGVAVPETQADVINSRNAQRERRQAEMDALVERASLGQQGRRASAVWGEGKESPPRAPAPPVNMPERRRTEGVVLDPVRAYVDEQRRAGTPAGRFFAQEFDAGRITPDEVAALMGRRPQTDDEATQERLQRAAAQSRREQTPDERLAAAAAQARAPSGLVTEYGMPLRADAPARAAAPVAGEQINRAWTRFAPESGTLGVPREQMPQIAAEHRGALVRFLNARGIEHEAAEVPADSLKPTQAEFSPAKVARASEAGSDRSILVSGDGFVLDGHHQWLAAREKGEPVKVIRLDAPVQDLLRLAHQFPSSTTAPGVKRAQSAVEPAQTGAKAAAEPADAAPEAPAEPPRAAAEPAPAPASSVTDLAAQPLADVFMVGDAFELGGKPVRVAEVKSSVVRLADGSGKLRSVSRGGVTFKQLLEQVVRRRGAAPAATEPAQVAPAAMHADPGDRPEQATPAVVAESLETAARRVDRKPSEMRAELLERIDAAIKEAPDYGDFQQSVKTLGEKDAVSVFTDARGTMGEKHAPADYSRPKLTFDVKGDGVFTVNNTVRSLLEFRREVERSPGFKDRRTPAPAMRRINGGGTKQESGALFGVERGSGSAESAVANMIDEGDYQLATEFASDQGVDIAKLKLPKDERVKFDAWQKAMEAHNQRQPKAAEQKPALDAADSAPLDAPALSRAQNVGVPASTTAPGAQGDARTGAETTAVTEASMPPERDGYARLFHGGGPGLSEVRDSGRFGGLFASDSRASAKSHGTGNLYFADIPQDKVLSTHDLNYEMDYDEVRTALQKAMPWLHEEDEDSAWKAVIEDRSDRVDEDDMLRIFRVDDFGEASWEAQRIRGKVAALLGFQAVEMDDEHGMSYLMTPGVKLTRILPNEPSAPAGSGAALSRGTATAGVPVAELRAAVSSITSEWVREPDAPRVHVVATAFDLPDDALNALYSLGAADEARGLRMSDGRVYLVADKLQSIAEGQFVLFHEAYGHHGLRAFLGKAYGREMMLLRQANLKLRTEADAWFAKYGEATIEAAMDRGLTREQAELRVRALATEEALADRAGNDTPPSGWKGLMARLQRALRRVGLDGAADWLERLTEAETWALLRDARRLVREGRPLPDVAQGQPAHAREAAASRGDSPQLSRMGDYLSSADGARAVRDAVGDLIKNPGVFNPWHKTIGTQYQKAQKSPLFRRVYEAAQDFLHDTSFFANTAADLAPDLLPRLERLKDVAKRLNLSKADSEAVAKAVFGGTLAKERYDADQLREKFGFTGKQTDLYRQFRAAVDTSLDQLANAEVTRLMGDDAPDGARALLQDGQYGEHRARVESRLADNLAAARRDLQAARDRHAQEAQRLRAGDQEPDAAAVAEMEARHAKELRPLEAAADKWRGLQDQVSEKLDRLDKLKAEGYAPLMRFGRYSVHVTNDAGETLYFGLYESRLEANRARRALQDEFKGVPGATATAGVMSLEAYKLMQGVSPETLAVFGDAAGLSKDEVFQQYLKLATANHSALRRLIHRKGIAGFNQDPTRVLAAFLTSNARRASSLLHNGDMDKAVRAAQESKQGDVADEAFKLRDYVQNPTEEAAGLKNLLFVNYLGGSVASALVNLTQPMTMTFPYLSQFGGPAKAGARLIAAAKDALGAISDARLKEALHKAEAEGILAPQEMHELQAEAQRRLSSHPIARKTMFAWGSLFSLAEAMNRRVTFIAAWRTATAEGKGDPFAFAVKAVEETQGIYNKGNRPNWARGAVGGTLLTFKQFSISYLEFFSRLPAREKALAMAVLVLAAGMQGLPFADDLDDVLDTIGQRLGYNTNSKLWKQRVLTEALGKPVADLLLRGVTGLPGSPIDVAGRMSLGNLIPGSGLLRKDRQDKASDVAELLGAVGGLGKQAAALASGDVMGALPTSVQNIAKGADMLRTGAYRDTRGRKVVDADTGDAVVKMLGFQPGAVAQEQRRAGAIQQTINMAKAVREEVSARWADGLFEGDQDKVKAAREQLRDWNAKNPESRINLPIGNIQQRVKAMRSSREDRLEKAAPKSMRPAVRDALAA